MSMRCRSNTLIVRDIPTSITEDRQFAASTRPENRKQVEIDARVVQASRSFAREIGTLFAYSTSTGGNVFGGNSAVGVSRSLEQCSRVYFAGARSRHRRADPGNSCGLFKAVGDKTSSPLELDQWTELPVYKS